MTADKTSHKSKGKQQAVEHPPLTYRLKALEAVVGLKRTAIHARIAAGDFPRPIALGPRAKAWLVSEVEEWLRRRAEQRDKDEAAQAEAGAQKRKRARGAN